MALTRGSADRLAASLMLVTPALKRPAGVGSDRRLRSAREPRRGLPKAGAIRRLAGLAALTAAALLAPGTAAGEALPSAFPAAGEVLVPVVLVHARPDQASKVVRRLAQVRPDSQLRVVLALEARRDAGGLWWYRLSLPGRPNGQRGWVRSDLVDVRPVANRIVVDRGARTLEVRRIATGKLLLRTVVAVGKPGAETPLGHGFYVQSRYVPSDPFFGTFALETSAYSKLTDWPGGGVVGIHGTNLPELLGQAVSHGCVRVLNAVASRLKTLAPVGTVIDVIP
jgi:lipoprotein-anchoring transpeptidase ErfK/SrfK